MTSLIYNWKSILLNSLHKFSLPPGLSSPSYILDLVLASSPVTLLQHCIQSKIQNNFSALFCLLFQQTMSSLRANLGFHLTHSSTDSTHRLSSPARCLLHSIPTVTPFIQILHNLYLDYCNGPLTSLSLPWFQLIDNIKEQMQS